MAAKRAHIRLMIGILKWMFCLMLFAGIYIYFTTNYSMESTDDIPEPGEVDDSSPAGGEIAKSQLQSDGEDEREVDHKDTPSKQENIASSPAGGAIAKSQLQSKGEEEKGKDHKDTPSKPENIASSPAGGEIAKSQLQSKGEEEKEKDHKDTPSKPENIASSPAGGEIAKSQLQSKGEEEKGKDHKDTPSKQENIEVTNIETPEKSDENKEPLVIQPTDTGKCPGLTLPIERTSKYGWRPVDTSDRVYVYSAFYNAERQIVYMIGIRQKEDIPLFCQAWRHRGFARHKVYKEVEAKPLPVVDDRGYRFIATIFECKLEYRPSYVSLVSTRCDLPLNAFEVNKVTPKLPYNRALTVCVPPSTLTYGNSTEFLNWIEVNILYGAQRFVMYNYSTNPNIAPVVNHYMDQGLIKVMPWKPPVIVSDEEQKRRPQIWKYGEIAALNECLFRNKRYSEYITNIGVNEYIIPSTRSRVPLDSIIPKLDKSSPAFHISMPYRKKLKPGVPGQPKKPSDNTNAGNEADEYDEINEEDQVTKRPLRHEEKLAYQEKKIPIAKQIIRTSDVDFALVNSVPDLEVRKMPHSSIQMHRFPGVGKPQRLGNNVHVVLPTYIRQRLSGNVQKIKNSLPEIQ